MLITKKTRTLCSHLNQKGRLVAVFSKFEAVTIERSAMRVALASDPEEIHLIYTEIDGIPSLRYRGSTAWMHSDSAEGLVRR